MKKIAILTILFLIVQILLAQEIDIPRGGYMSYSELKSKKPSIPFDFEIERRSKEKIHYYHGKVYEVKCKQKTFSKKKIKKDIYAISTGSHLYLNCKKLYGKAYYAKAETTDKYISFIGPIGKGDADRIRHMDEVTNWTPDSTLSGTYISDMIRLYILDTITGSVLRANRAVLSNILDPYPKLRYYYQHEEHKDSQEVMIRYLLLVNDK